MLPLGHISSISSVQFSPDGKKIVTDSYDGTAKIWDIASGKLIADLEHKDLGSARFSPDGKRVVTSSYGSSKTWDAISGNFLVKFMGGGEAQFSPDGKKLLPIHQMGLKYGMQFQENL